MSRQNSSCSCAALKPNAPESHKRVSGQLAELKQGRENVTQEVLKGRSVLLIEDSWLIAQGYKSLLEMSGMEVVGPAASVADAEELLLARAPDMALVDINVQGGVSYGLIDALVKRGIPVLVVSGNDVLPSVAAKVDRVLTKPIGGAALLTALRGVAAARHF